MIGLTLTSPSSIKIFCIVLLTVENSSGRISANAACVDSSRVSIDVPWRLQQPNVATRVFGCLMLPVYQYQVSKLGFSCYSGHGDCAASSGQRSAGLSVDSELNTLLLQQTTRLQGRRNFFDRSSRMKRTRRPIFALCTSAGRPTFNIAPRRILASNARASVRDDDGR